jgi:hypothetical protein
MDTHQIYKLFDRYESAVDKLDSAIEPLSDTEKKQFQEVKTKFRQLLYSWKKTSQREYRQLESNLEESYRQLETVWYNAQQKTNKK